MKILSELLNPLNKVKYNKMFSDAKCNFYSKKVIIYVTSQVQNVQQQQYKTVQLRRSLV
jgi:hypothetical protein